MSRRLVITILIVLIVGVVGGTVALVVSRLRTSGNTPTPTPSGGSLQEAATGKQQVVDPTGDDDGDGLNNADEAIWGTDPKNPDTDGDGYKDGEEVAASHNPTIPAPNDKLPEGFKPGKDISPLQTAPSEPVAVDQFFASGLDLSLGGNLTDEYNNQYKEADRTPQTMADFALSHAIVTQLPPPTDKSTSLADKDTAAGLDTYLNTVGSFGPMGNSAAMASAVQALAQQNDPSLIKGIALTARSYQEQLIAASVPPAAQSFHRLLLGYSQLFISTVDHMGEWQDDRVKAIVAIRQLQENDKKYFPLLLQERDRLRALVLQLASGSQ